MQHRLNYKSIFSLTLCLSVGLAFFAKPVAAQLEEPADAVAVPANSSSGVSAVPGEMDAVEQLFVNEGKPSDEVINDGPPKAPVVHTKSGEVEMKGVSDLANLAEFKDIAVIQKRFLPKTGRFEAFGGLNGILNDKFFVNFGINGRLAYFFNERWAIEASAMALATGEKGVTRDLRERRGVVTSNFVSPTSYYGVDVKWMPVYGKMSFINRKITPFDLYFSAGAGVTNTKTEFTTGSSPTIHFGTGQIFALSKSMAVRWDFSWNFYSATSGPAGAQVASTYNNLFLTVGASFFFPEATYR